MDGTAGTSPAAAVRYTGLVGAIDRYLDDIISWDHADLAARLGVGQGCVGDRDEVRARGETRVGACVLVGLAGFCCK